MAEFNTIDDFDLENKTVLVRVDINAPVDPGSGIILDDTRLKLHSQTIKELSNKGVSFISVEMSNGQLLADVQFAALRKEDTHLVNRMGGNLIELKQILAKIYEIAGFEDEDIDLSKRSEEKASPNIID